MDRQEPISCRLKAPPPPLFMLPDSWLKLKFSTPAYQHICFLSLSVIQKERNAPWINKDVIVLEFVFAGEREWKHSSNVIPVFSLWGFYCFKFQRRNQLQPGNLPTHRGETLTVLSRKSKGLVTLNNRGACCAEGLAARAYKPLSAQPSTAGTEERHRGTRLETRRYEGRESCAWKRLKMGGGCKEGRWGDRKIKGKGMKKVNWECSGNWDRGTEG